MWGKNDGDKEKYWVQTGGRENLGEANAPFAPRAAVTVHEKFSPNIKNPLSTSQNVVFKIQGTAVNKSEKKKTAWYP